MKKELDDLLCERYPLIFANRSKPFAESCMAWGFDCDDGWFDLIDTLCERLQDCTDRNRAPQIVASQVKQKLGRLVFYCDESNDVQNGMIYLAEDLSKRICETCGAPGRLLVDNGRWLTRCSAHAPDGALTPDEFEKLLQGRRSEK